MAYNHDSRMHPRKNGARSVAVLPIEKSGKRSPVKTALFMPGKEALCVREALASGLINRKTHLIAVEADPTIAAAMRQVLNKLGFKKVTLHVGRLETFDLCSVLAADEQIEYAFFDLCGELTPALGLWWLWQHKAIHSTATVAFTLSTRLRNNPLLESLRYRGNHAYCTELDPNLSRTFPRYRTLVALQDLKLGTGNVGLSLRGLFGVLASTTGFKVTDCISYCDTTPMVMVRLQLQKRRTPDMLAARDCVRATINELLLAKKYGDMRQTVAGRTPDAALWKVLGCPFNMTAGEKAAAVRSARLGKRPLFLKPQQWAVCRLNPKGRFRVRDAAVAVAN